MTSKSSVPEEFEVRKTETEWKRLLSRQAYNVLRGKGTEASGAGEYVKFFPKKGKGFFVCKACKNPLYSAKAKFKSGCGWPAFDKCFKGSIVTDIDYTFGVRTEIMCGKCGGHLGHVFKGEKLTSTNERHCVNSISVVYTEDPIPNDLEETKVL